jgi:hypothetical protein
MRTPTIPGVYTMRMNAGLVYPISPKIACVWSGNAMSNATIPQEMPKVRAKKVLTDRVVIAGGCFPCCIAVEDMTPTSHCRSLIHMGRRVDLVPGGALWTCCERRREEGGDLLLPLLRGGGEAAGVVAARDLPELNGGR